MLRRVRLATGLILFTYVTTHFFNHALGLISLDSLAAGRGLFLAVWRNPVGTLLLYGAIAVHILLAAWALYDRRSLRMRAGEAMQIVLGFSIPFLLLTHIVGTRGAHELYGTQDTYAFVLWVQWQALPHLVYLQTAGMAAAWVHGCIGLYYWLRLKPWFARVMPVAFAAAVLLPVVAWLGFAVAGRDVVALAQDRDWRVANVTAAKPPTAAGVAHLYEIADIAKIVVGLLVVVALGGRGIRQAVEARRGMVTVTYPEGRQGRGAPGTTILEISRLNRVPHASVCGGRGRCSTCRVRIVDGEGGLPLPSAEERRVLERVGAPPRVRLACQTVPATDVSVVPLLPPNATVDDVRGRGADLAGQERDIVILFADLRSFTQFSEKKLPYDVVFVLNRYFAHMGEAVEKSGGHLDKFIGDGVMALFGVDADIGTAADQALRAAQRMSEKLADLNQQLAGELDEPLRIGIGLHAGPAIIGEMGYGAATGLTAIGDSVNTASRLETLTKEYGAQLVFSEAVASRSSLGIVGDRIEKIAVRGRDETIRVHVVTDAKTLGLA